jgi:hypothetical protein
MAKYYRSTPWRMLGRGATPVVSPSKVTEEGAGLRADRVRKPDATKLKSSFDEPDTENDAGENDTPPGVLEPPTRFNRKPSL